MKTKILYKLILWNGDSDYEWLMWQVDERNMTDQEIKDKYYDGVSTVETITKYEIGKKINQLTP